MSRRKQSDLTTRPPSTDAAGSGDRMPPLPAAAMTEAQNAAARELICGPRGEVMGPFIPALRSPELTTRLQRLGEYLRYHNALGARLTEMTILLTARQWTQQFEWHVHAPLAEQHGLSVGLIEAIADGRRPAEMAEDEAALYDFFIELDRNGAVSDSTYARALGAFGETGVIDLVATVGYYGTLAMVMNVARTPLPPGAEPGLAPFPR
jgi:4-carboxymuconolactone decarboxylase